MKNFFFEEIIKSDIFTIKNFSANLCKVDINNSKLISNDTKLCLN